MSFFIGFIVGVVVCYANVVILYDKLSKEKPGVKTKNPVKPR